jgi:hypothetical protein
MLSAVPTFSIEVQAEPYSAGLLAPDVIDPRDRGFTHQLMRGDARGEWLLVPTVINARVRATDHGPYPFDLLISARNSGGVLVLSRLTVDSPDEPIDLRKVAQIRWAVVLRDVVALVAVRYRERTDRLLHRTHDADRSARTSGRERDRATRRNRLPRRNAKTDADLERTLVVVRYWKDQQGIFGHPGQWWLKQAMRELNVSRAQLYRDLRAAGYDGLSKTKPRKTKPSTTRKRGKR